MDEIESGVVGVLHEVLGPDVAAAGLDATSPLLGAVPELDSMAVVAVLAGIEAHFGISLEDDEVDGSVFASVGSLAALVRAKRAA